MEPTTSDTPRTADSRLGLAGAALVVGASAGVVVEAVAAAASPGYSYVDDKIAYLGSPYCGPIDGRVVCSPHWQAMLGTWLTLGALVLVAGLLLGRTVGGRLGRAVGVVAGIEAVGFALFSLFHDSPDARADGTIVPYFVGAGLTIVAGNVLPILVGRAHRRLALPAWLGRVSVALGIAGLAAAVVTVGWVPLGLAERISVYTFLLWQLLLGAVLIRRAAIRRVTAASRAVDGAR